MATLTGKTIANTYKDLLQVSNNNDGLTGTVQTISDGAGTNSALQLSNAAVNINGTFQLNGESLTVNASAINNMADIGSATGIIAVNSGSVYGRTLTAGAPVSITNANGTAGNPTITLASIANVSGSYGPFTNFGVNDYGQIVSATAVSTSVSVPTIRATELIAQTLTLSSDASVVGNLNVDGAFTVDGVVSAASDVAVSGSLYVTSNVSVTGNLKSDFLYAVSASVDDMRIGTLSFTDVSVSAFTASNLTIVSAATLAGTDLGTKITALETSIGTANTRITSVSDFAVALSATMATSIGNSNTLIAATSAALATSIGNSNTNITTNINAITSINSILGDGSGFATDAELQAVSAAMATSIANHLPLAGGTLTGALTTNGNITSTGNQITVGDNAAAGGSYDSVLHLLGDASSGFKLSTNSANTAFNLEREYFGWQGGLTMKRDTGNLGIGTTSPASLLDINGADGIPFTLRGTSSSAALGMGLTSTSVIIQAQTTAAEATALVFKTAPSSGTETEAMRITGDGNVGIGTTSPGTELEIAGDYQPLTVNSTTGSNAKIILENNGTVIGYLGAASGVPFIVHRSSDAGSMFQFKDLNGYSQLHFAASTTAGGGAGGAYLQALGSNAASPPQIAGIDLSMTDGTDGSESGIIAFHTTNSGTSAERMRIDSSGNMIIGGTTAVTGAALTVEGPDSAAGSLNYVAAIRNSDAYSTTPASGIIFQNKYNSSGSYADAGGIEVVKENATDGEYGFGLGLHTRANGSAITEKLHITGDGNVGIGTTAPDGKLHVHTATAGSVTANLNADDLIIENSGFAGLSILTPHDQLASIVFGDPDDNDVAGINYDHSGNSMRFVVNAGEKVRIDAYGRMGIGTSTPGAELEITGDYQPLIVNSTTSSSAKILLEDNGTTRGYIGATSSLPVTFHNSSATIVGGFTNSGGLGVNTSSPDADAKLDVNGQVLVRNTGAVVDTTPGGQYGFYIQPDSGGTVNLMSYSSGGGTALKFYTNSGGAAAVERMSISGAGAVAVVGAFSKGSGSFKIDHPLPAKKDTHHLVHSFVEGPQADLIYRGRATLVDGQASVNIDDAAGMTSGTFEVLCRDIQCFTSNETGWTAVRGSVTGATLTIEAQDNSCTDTISWMVVGERKDQHMYDTNWTDDDGKVIVEPLKQDDK